MFRGRMSVNLDWLIERVKLDSNMSVKYVHTNKQIADILPKGFHM